MAQQKVLFMIRARLNLSSFFFWGVCMSDDVLVMEFLEESLESLTSLDETIVKLVDSTDITKDVNEIFRPVHSIKGAASFFKLDGLMHMAHKLETVLDQLRQLHIPVSPELIDTLGRGFYLLRNLVERGQSGDHNMSPDDEVYLGELDVILNGDGESMDVQLHSLLEMYKAKGGDPQGDGFEKVLRQALGCPEDEASEGALTSIKDLVELEASSPDASNVKKIREAVEDIKGKLDHDAEAHKALDSFLEDFNALVDSPVGLDEMMAEVVLGHLSDAEQALPADFCATNEEDAAEVEENIEPKKEESEAKSVAKVEAKKDAKSSGSIRVSVNLLEDIMNLMSELVLSRNELNVHAAAIEHPALGKTTQQVSSIMTDLQGKVMKTRLQPVSTVFNPLPGVVREISRALGKEVDLILEGKATELDRGVLEGIKDPLTHILRNSLDHGFEMPEERLEVGKPERGQLLIRAFHEGGQVVIEIKDDGRGVNRQKVAEKAIEKGLYSREEIDAMSEAQMAEIIFNPGFSTADQVSQVSGRGVGMDVVKSNIVSLGGQVELDTKFGVGTSLKLRIPLTLAIVPALIVGAEGQQYAIPQVNLEEMVLLKHSELHRIEMVRGVEVFRLRGKILPVLRLNKILRVKEPEESEGLNLVILSSGSQSFALIVESLFDIEEIVVKSLDDLVSTNKIFSGATILGDGSIALIFDVLQISELCGLGGNQGVAETASPQLSTGYEDGQMLLFSLEEHRIFGVPMDYVERLEQIEPQRIDKMNDRWYLRYRERILPLLGSWGALGLSTPLTLPDELHVVVYRDGGLEMGFVVHEIVDVVDVESPLVQDLNDEAYFLGSTILQSKVVTVINLPYLAEQLLGKKAEHKNDAKERVLLWETSPEMSEKAMGLRNKGYEVTEVHSREEVSEVIQNVDIDILLTEDALGPQDRADLEEQISDRYGADSHVSVVSIAEDEQWQSELNSEQLSDAINSILNDQMEL